MRVEPDERQALEARGEALDRADVGAAAAAEHERALGKRRRQRELLLAEARLLDDRHLRVHEVERRARDHDVTTVPPGPRDAHEAGRELAPAGVALVAGADRDRGVRPAVRALAAEDAHASTFSYASVRRTTACLRARRARRLRSCSPRRRRGRPSASHGLEARGTSGGAGRRRGRVAATAYARRGRLRARYRVAARTAEGEARRSQSPASAMNQRVGIERPTMHHELLPLLERRRDEVPVIARMRR